MINNHFARFQLPGNLWKTKKNVLPIFVATRNFLFISFMLVKRCVLPLPYICENTVNSNTEHRTVWVVSWRTKPKKKQKSEFMWHIQENVCSLVRTSTTKKFELFLLNASIDFLPKMLFCLFFSIYIHRNTSAKSRTHTTVEIEKEEETKKKSWICMGKIQTNFHSQRKLGRERSDLFFFCFVQPTSFCVRVFECRCQNFNVIGRRYESRFRWEMNHPRACYSSKMFVLFSFSE
jgi:hypothetical protein